MAGSCLTEYDRAKLAGKPWKSLVHASGAQTDRYESALTSGGSPGSRSFLQMNLLSQGICKPLTRTCRPLHPLLKAAETCSLDPDLQNPRTFCPPVTGAGGFIYALHADEVRRQSPSSSRRR